MFERLLELFLHAKSGVVATVFVLGTTGALVTATTQNGVTTLTFTQASPSPSAATQTTTSPSPSASPSTSTATNTSALISQSTLTTQSGTTSTTCDPHPTVDAVHTVNTAFSQFHTDLMHLRTNSEAARDIVKDADKLLKEIRQTAVKALHEQFNCGKTDDDEDEDEDEDEDDEDSESSAHHDNVVAALFAALQNLFAGGQTVTLNTSGDPQTIADNAVAAMQVVFDKAKSDLENLPAQNAKPHDKKSPEPQNLERRGDDRGGEHGKGNGKSKGRD